ncbi:MAG TPA: trehalose-phosphatase [Acetobacteraceae bacterium]|nr:trehalose-phosphatase [Acetobacteraceae bacterium]
MKPSPAPDITPSLPPLPPPSRLAVLLDLDGTLLDLAATPDAVRVPPALPATLARLTERLGGAFAVVSGRTVGAVADLFPGLAFAIAGEHGGAIRRTAGAPLERPPLPALRPEWREAAARLAADHPGILFEGKPHGFVLHYRQMPQAGPELGRALTALLDGEAELFGVFPAAMAWEVRPRGISKADAVRSLLGAPPFAGRVPLFIGDDATDEDGIRAARDAGGFGFRVQETFGDAAGVRAWLASLAPAQEGSALENAERGA